MGLWVMGQRGRERGSDRHRLRRPEVAHPDEERARLTARDDPVVHQLAVRGAPSPENRSRASCHSVEQLLEGLLRGGLLGRLRAEGGQSRRCRRRRRSCRAGLRLRSQKRGTSTLAFLLENVHPEYLRQFRESSTPSLCAVLQSAGVCAEAR